jgi:hypothetical protein
MVADWSSGTGIVAPPGFSLVGGYINALADEKRDKGEGVAGDEQGVLIQRASCDEDFSLVYLAWVYSVALTEFQRSIITLKTLGVPGKKNEQKKKEYRDVFHFAESKSIFKIK